jgi:hypothetical protein
LFLNTKTQPIIAVRSAKVKIKKLFTLDTRRAFWRGTDLIIKGGIAKTNKINFLRIKSGGKQTEKGFGVTIVSIKERSEKTPYIDFIKLFLVG